MAKRYALLFSSEEYRSALKTPHCHADRELLARTLTESCDYAFDDVHSITLTKEDEKQTSLVMDHLSAAKERLQAGDTVLFYYAGHGVSVDDEPYLILPTTDINNIERTAIAIRDISNELRVEGVQCFRIFDSCHSGVDVRDGDHRGEPLMRGVMKRPDGWVTLAGCDPDESCYSTPDEGHGVFTKRLAQAITEVPVGKDVRPESLKVRTCELVEEWCNTFGKVQTPTLIATVRGNISLATRRAPIKPLQPDEKQVVEAKPPEDVRARLLALQGSIPPGSKVYWEHYAKLRDGLREQLEANLEFLKGYAAPLDQVKTARLDAEIDSLETPVVDLVEKNNWISLHTIQKEVEMVRDEPMFGSVLSMNPYRSTPTRRVVHRTLSQERSQPESVVTAELKKVGAEPGLKLIHYLCPLQTRFLLYTKIEIDGLMTTDGTTWYGCYTLALTDNFAAAKSHTDFVVGKAKDMFRSACETNIKYLESEQGKK